MKKLPCLVALSVILASCRKEITDPVNELVLQSEVYSEATYQITVTGRWNATDFVVPPSVHFTRIAGAVHSKDLSLWKEGTLASKSLELIAENGNAVLMWTDVDAYISNGKAFEKIAASTPPPTGTSVFTVNANTNFSLVSFASMLAPTPDWFFGVSSLPLYRNQSWIRDTTLELYSYDAGTEDGDEFGYNNPETSPQKAIQLLSTLNGSILFKGSVRPIAEMRIERE